MNYIKESTFKHFLAIESVLLSFLISFQFLFSFKGLTELSLTCLLKETKHDLRNKYLISQVFIKFFKPKFTWICILIIILAADDTHQSIDVIIKSEVSWTGYLVQFGKLH